MNGAAAGSEHHAGITFLRVSPLRSALGGGPDQTIVALQAGRKTLAEASLQEIMTEKWAAAVAGQGWLIHPA